MSDDARLERLAALIQRFGVWAPTVTAARLRSHRTAQLALVPEAAPPRVLAIVCAGNLPVSAWQAMCRAALLGVPGVRVKLPHSPHAPAIAAFAAELAAAGLVDDIVCEPDLPQDWLTTSDAVVAFGSDDTMDTLRRRVPHGVPFVAYGHKLSVGVIEAADVSPATARLAARDLLTHDQEGCLSPQAFYVAGGPADGFAQLLDEALAEAGPSPLGPDATGRVFGARRQALFRGARVIGPDDLRWTLLLEPRPAFRATCLHRTVGLASVPDHDALTAVLAEVAPHLSTVGMSRVAPFPCGASRFCPLGHMQFPELEWRQDGREPLAGLMVP